MNPTNSNLPQRWLDGAEASAYLLQQHGLPRSEKTLAKLRCKGGGPRFVLKGRFPRYTTELLDEFAAAMTSEPVSSTSELGERRRKFIQRK